MSKRLQDAPRDVADEVEELNRELALHQLRLHVNALKRLNARLEEDDAPASVLSAAISYIARSGAAKAVHDLGPTDKLEEYVVEARKRLQDGPKGRRRVDESE